MTEGLHCEVLIPGRACRFLDDLSLARRLVIHAQLQVGVGFEKAT